MNLLEKAYALSANDFNIGIASPSSGTVNIRDVAVSVVNMILVVAAVLAVIFLIYSGILYLTAAGNEDNANKGKKGIINAIIGIIIIVLALVIMRVVANTARNVAG